MNRRNIMTRRANRATHVNIRRAIGLAMALVTTLSSSPLLGQEQSHAAHAQESTVPLFDNLGDHHREISTSVPEVQAYFDQGLRLQYAFNHAEAIRAYEEALRRDPACAMCWWGIALAYGPNINASMDEESGRLACAAIEKARELAAGASARERAMIEALATRYSADPQADRAALDAAYAAAMSELAARYSDDADLLALHGAAIMNLSPWNYWSGDYGNRVPNERTPELLNALERALSIDQYNPGACHYYIHAVEAAYPERAEACADRLAALMPGAGHIVHMPGHVYIRVGRYADAVRANEHAVHADETYIADQGPVGLYPSAYYPHNYHFMWFAASLAGMSETAIEAAKIVAPKVPVEIAREVPFLQSVLALPQLAAITFGRWDEALAAAAPPAGLPVGEAMHRYARGTALAATGDFDGARTELAAVERLVSGTGPELAAAEPVGGAAGAEPNPVLQIAAHALAGEIALRSGETEAAVIHFQAAAAIEDEMQYEEPPLWYFPVRHSLGRALLEAGRPAEAEQAYREDLQRFRANGWSLFGLAQSLEAQGKTAEAAEAMARFRDAWRAADIELPSSRF
jgi:tetratricopeptide (TPR) repeat protein